LEPGRRCAFGRERGNVPPVPFQPARAFGDAFGLHVVRSANQVHHGGVAQLVAVTAQDAAAHARIGTGADLDAGGVERRAWGGRLPEDGHREQSDGGEAEQQSCHGECSRRQ